MQVSGLEINESNVALLELKRSGKKLYVASFSKADLPAGTIVNGLLKNKENFLKALSVLKTSGRPKKNSSPYVIVALPESLVYLTTTHLPNLEEEKIKEAIEINLKDFLPGKPEEIYWGWQEILGPKTEKEILIASAQQNNLKQYLEVLNIAGFIPVAIESFSLAAIRAFSKPLTGLVISLEKDSATCIVMEEGIPKFATSFLLMQEKTIENLLAQVKRVLNYYKAKKRRSFDQKIFPVILVGNAASAEVQKFLQEKLNIAIKLGQELMVFPVGEIKSPAVTGAAIRGLIDPKDDTNLSLLPVGTKESYEENRALKIVGGITNIFIITCLIFILIFGGFWGFLYYLNSSADNQIASTAQTKLDPKVKEIQGQLQQLDPKLNYMKELLASGTSFANLLSDIRIAGAGGISFTTISLPKEGKIITVNGNAQSRDALAVFKNNLGKIEKFSKVDFSSTNVAEQNTSFTVNLTIK